MAAESRGWAELPTILRRIQPPVFPKRDFPITGYGAKAAYRGDKLTKRVWAEILEGGFVAQALVPPSERLVDVNGVGTRLKLDLRAYSYRGQVQLLAARTWSGQTTNFRTTGGGFSPVIVLPDLSEPGLTDALAANAMAHASTTEPEPIA